MRGSGSLDAATLGGTGLLPGLVADKDICIWVLRGRETAGAAAGGTRAAPALATTPPLGGTLQHTKHLAIVSINLLQ